MQNETDRQGVDVVSQGERGGRVYTVRNVDTGDWTGRLMLGNTLGRNRQDAKVLLHCTNFKIPRNVTFSHYFHAGCLRFHERAIIISSWLTEKEFVLCFLLHCGLVGPSQKPQRVGRREITFSGPGFTKPKLQATKFGCLVFYNRNSCKCVCLVVV